MGGEAGGGFGAGTWIAVMPAPKSALRLASFKVFAIGSDLTCTKIETRRSAAMPFPPHREE